MPTHNDHGDIAGDRRAPDPVAAHLANQHAVEGKISEPECGFV